MTRMEGAGVLQEGTEEMEDWFGLTHVAVRQPVARGRVAAGSAGALTEEPGKLIFGR